jgi:hypothetical protein
MYNCGLVTGLCCSLSPSVLVTTQKFLFFETFSGCHDSSPFASCVSSFRSVFPTIWPVVLRFSALSPRRHLKCNGEDLCDQCEYRGLQCVYKIETMPAHSHSNSKRSLAPTTDGVDPAEERPKKRSKRSEAPLEPSDEYYVAQQQRFIAENQYARAVSSYASVPPVGAGSRRGSSDKNATSPNCFHIRIEAISFYFHGKFYLFYAVGPCIFPMRKESTQERKNDTGVVFLPSLLNNLTSHFL